MENTEHKSPLIHDTTEAKCACCGNSMYIETSIVEAEQGDGSFIPHRVVTGSFMQFIDKDGLPLGPIWPRCVECTEMGRVVEPIDNPEIISYYSKFEEAINATS